MSKSNFPNGFTGGVTIRGIPITIAHPGQVFWLNNTTVLTPGGVGGSNGSPGTFLRPFSTLTYAISQCTANRGDVIMVMPGHAENVATAGAINVNVAGVAIVGLGTGTKRPKFSSTAAAATFVVSAADCSFYNLEFQANFADVAIGLDVSGVDGLSFENCYFTEAGSGLNYVDVVDLATGADDISFKGCKFILGDVANDACISGVAHSGMYIEDCVFYANVAQTAAHGLIVSTGNVTNLRIRNCDFRSNVDGAVFIDLDGTANGGCVSYCNFSSIDDAGAVTTGFDVTGAHVFECYVAGEADSFGLVGGGTVYNNA